MIGRTLAHYRITAELGAGGMGEVWRAEDTRLGREVALKVLPEEFARDPERMARFEREAKVLASLNHPNIATLYGLETVGSVTGAERGTIEDSSLEPRASSPVTFLAMELVEGEDLSERIARGAIPADEAIPIALQIAEALEAAHEQGIVHRDLKPANIKITEDGTVKVLDFGLAKANQEEVGGTNSSELPTATQTQMGVILGTAPYMSPEQASGRVVDRRADIWAFGVVLWEMLIARRLFDGESGAEIRASVLTEDPQYDSLPSATPLAIRSLLRKCLEREPRRRMQHMGDVRLVLEDFLVGGDQDLLETETSPPKTSLLPWLMAGTMALVGVLAVLSGFITKAENQTGGAPLQFEVRIPSAGLIVPAEIMSRLAVSPDGRRLALAAQVGGETSLYLREFDRLEAIRLDGTDGAFSPFWSPDSTAVGYFANGRIMRVEASGGPPRVVCEANFQGRAVWSGDGSIVFAELGRRHSGLSRVDATGGDPEPLTSVDRALGEVFHLWPQYLPDQGMLFYLRGAVSPEGRGIVRHLMVSTLDGENPRTVMPLDSRFEIVPTGEILYVQDGTLLAQPFDVDRALPVGEPTSLVSRLGYMIQTGQAEFTTSRTGVLAVHGGLSTTELVVFDRSGREIGKVGKPAAYGLLRLDPSGGFLAVESYDSRLGSRDIWIHDLRLGTARRLTLAASDDTDPMWWPDGKQVLFASDIDGAPDIYRLSLDGGGVNQVVVRGPGPLEPKDVMPSSSEVMYSAFSTETNADLWLTIAGGDGDVRPYLRTDHTETDARITRDGRWVTFLSDETGSKEVYVARADDASTRRRVSLAGGWSPLWRADGRELYFISPQGAMAAAFDPDSGKFPGRPETLFEFKDNVWRGAWDVSPDGESFFVNRSIVDRRRDPIRVMLDWRALLEPPAGEGGE